MDTNDPGRSPSHAPGFEGFDTGNLAVGNFYGLRAFDMHDGGLFGITYPQEWETGINQAFCYNPMRTTSPAAHKAISRWRYGPGMVPVPCPPPVKPGPGEPGHKMGPCSCGYWAFHEPESATFYMSRAGRVGGIVQLLGTVKAGTRGWRASKGAIVALIAPRVDTYDQDSWDEVQWRFHVPVYGSVEEALIDWPLTRPDRRMLCGGEE